MSGWDWFAVVLLSGVVIVTAAFDQLRARRRRNADQPCNCWMCSSTRQHRYEREIGRLP